MAVTIWFGAVRFHQPRAKLSACSALFAIVSILSSCAVNAEDGGFENVPSPIIVKSGRLLLRTTNPANSRIGESIAFSPDGSAMAAGRVELSYDKVGELAMGTEYMSDDGAAGEIRLWEKETGRDRFVFQGQMSRVCSVAIEPDGHTLAAASREGVFLWDLAIPSLKRETIANSPTGARGDTHQTDSRRSGTAKKSNQWTRIDDVLIWLMSGISLLAVLMGFAGGLNCWLLVYKATPECRSLIKCWMEQNGMSLLRCRMFVIPVFYRLSVEDGRGTERRGWACVDGKFATTPEFIPLSVRYFFLWPVVGHTKASTTHASIPLWDDWLDHQLEA